MKIFCSALLFAIFLSLSFFLTSSSLYAQYDNEGNHFEDSAKTPQVIVKSAWHKVNFEKPQDSIYIYHMVAEGESVTSILNLYQLCSPCFAEWNKYVYSGVKNLTRQKLYTGEYLKVALKKDYYGGFPSESISTYRKETIPDRTSLYKIARKYNTSVTELKRWNNYNEYVYNIEANTKIIVGKRIYKYVCPCKE